MTPEQKARVSIDALLVAADWRVCDVAIANIHAASGAAMREVVAEIDVNLQYAHSFAAICVDKLI